MARGNDGTGKSPKGKSGDFPLPWKAQRSALPTFPPPRRLLHSLRKPNPERSFPPPLFRLPFRLILRLEKTGKGKCNRCLSGVGLGAAAPSSPRHYHEAVSSLLRQPVRPRSLFGDLESASGPTHFFLGMGTFDGRSHLRGWPTLRLDALDAMQVPFHGCSRGFLRTGRRGLE